MNEEIKNPLPSGRGEFNALENSRTLVKEYDFRTLTDLDEFTTKFIWPRPNIINNELEFYVNPADVGSEHSPFILSDEGLSIVASQTHMDLLDYAVGLDKEGRKIGLNKLTAEEFEAHATPMPYTSGLLTTRDNGHSQLHGYWEASIRLPSATGAWSAFWLLPSLDQWPAGIAVLSEIDIMEGVASVSQGIYKGTLHSNQTGKLVSSENNDIHASADLTGEFHRYGLSWEPDVIIWYFDGIEVSRRRTPDDMQTEPRHFLLNLAVGGWGGKPVPGDYPAALEIEYVRIYDNPKGPVTPKEPAPDAIENAAKALELTAEYLRGIRKLV